MARFDQFVKLPALQEYLSGEGFDQATPVQAKAIPSLLKGDSIICTAQTGTGKTLAYALPLVELLKNAEKNGTFDHTLAKAPVALVLCPTRELAAQVFAVLKRISHFAKFRVRLLSGGDSSARTQQMRQGVDVLVAAPSRVRQALDKGDLSLEQLKILVADEADQMLDLGFAKELKNIYSKITSPCQLALFTATRPADLQEIALDVFDGATLIDLVIEGSHTVRLNIETYNIQCSQGEKPMMLELFLKEQGGLKGIIFVNRKETVDSVHQLLMKQFPKRQFARLHGDMDKKEREQAIKAFRDKNVTLVASDIAARGIDVKGIVWVLNYDLPFESVYYLHRCGRTGRAGVAGRVFNFVSSRDQGLIAKINMSISEQTLLKLDPIAAMNNKPAAAKAKGERVAKKAPSAKKKVATKKEEPKKKFVRATKKTPRYKKQQAKKK
jgi:superfamily II DNA/RNA helicase